MGNSHCPTGKSTGKFEPSIVPVDDAPAPTSGVRGRQRCVGRERHDGGLGDSLKPNTQRAALRDAGGPSHQPGRDGGAGSLTSPESHVAARASTRIVRRPSVPPAFSYTCPAIPPRRASHRPLPDQAPTAHWPPGAPQTGRAAELRPPRTRPQRAMPKSLSGPCAPPHRPTIRRTVHPPRPEGPWNESS